ncbi:hypothetical protein R5R35_005461 [Gryllus longicercus]|uniref:Uncharacterized protein n=1 Tax=Gryllus longicercus TaxID=2509291 RepID=A0AAN9WEC5_9ORTH
MAVDVEELERRQDEMLAEEANQCRLRIQEQLEAGGGVGVCPPTWDGIMCWDGAEAGELCEQPCPAYITGFDPRENVTRRCTETGWYMHPVSKTSWTNFSRCFNRPDATVILDPPKSNISDFEMFLPAVKIISTTGYAVSLMSLIAAFCILATVKKLRCPRNTLHMHLFLSFIMRAFMALLKHSLFVQGLGLPSDVTNTPDGDMFGSEFEENWECKLITSMWEYFIMANYSWILMEGLYLHNLIFLALFSDTSAITLYVTLGWGLPAVFVLAWVVCRLLLDDFVCWTVYRRPQLFLLVRVPIVASIILSFGLFVNIVRVLFLKLRASVCEETRRYRRWAKSTLVLVPLFGVHYTIFIGLSYSNDSRVELAYLFCDQLFASFQGFFVAVLYCFLNGEVRAEVARKWRRLRRRGAAGGARASVAGSLPGHTLISTAGGAGGGAGGGVANGPGRAGLPQGASRYSLPRASCYSTTSCTSLSAAGTSVGVGGGGANGFLGGWSLNKRRSGSGLDGGGGGGNARSCHSGLADLGTGSCFSNLSEAAGGRAAGERRWSSRSDYSVAGSALEMHSMDAGHI